MKDEERAALLSAQPPAGEGGGWRPIETAPYDKTMVALLNVRPNGHRSYGVGWYMPLEGWQAWRHDVPPTHWTPLPPAPHHEGESR